MIDAGSSGSRIHVYRFNYCREQPELEDEVFYPIEPGLSSYKDDAEAAAKSLDELMQVALENVPAELHHCTPIELKATAGLRLLGEGQSKKILDAVRTRLETQYPFPIAGGDHGIEIMDGKDEGVYAWITVNYLLGSLKKGRSAAVFDLGGASTQIVFEPTFASDGAMAEGEHKYLLDYGESQYTLYQHSYLGYGLNEARKKIKEEMIEIWKEEAVRSGHVYHPCLPANHTEQVAWEISKGKTQTVTLVGTGAGHAECRAVVERVFKKDKICALTPCAFDGMYQPPITETFTARDLYVFSFFYDLTQPLGMPSEFSVGELAELTQRVCSGESDPFKHVPNALEALNEKPDYCLDLTYIHGLLRVGYDVPPERLVRTAKKIRGAETGWCLGASIAMIDEAQICQVN
ncbi:nucleoside phosphatase GDA1/CD39 [Fennellomyces sp. T-0311]|nr:nucleoside phosphatase GDA1/CD39 [Fennellomyces sp. T-0311]